MAMQIPIADKPREQAHKIPNIFVLLVSHNISCASEISRLKIFGFFLFVASLICDLMLFGLARILVKIPSVNSIGEIPNIRKNPTTMPIQATVNIAFTLICPLS